MKRGSACGAGDEAREEIGVSNRVGSRTGNNAAGRTGGEFCVRLSIEIRLGTKENSMEQIAYLRNRCLL